MKIAAILISLIGSTAAAPALIWSKAKSNASTKHSSTEVHASNLFSSTVKSSKAGESSLDAVFFLVGRDADGNEGLRHLTSSGHLPNISAKYDDADSVHYHVNGVESGNAVAKNAMKGFGSKKADGRVLEATLEQFTRKLTSLHESAKIANEAEILPSGQVLPSAAKQQRRLSLALDSARVLVVTVDAKQHSELDAAVSAAIESDKVHSVVLSAVRSIEEVKRERGLAARQRFNLMTKVNRGGRVSRRLEDVQDDADDDAVAEEEGTYYVNMTPNILAGILFTIFFLFVAYTGLTCMNLIEGQDVYVSKYPNIGREA